MASAMRMLLLAAICYTGFANEVPLSERSHKPENSAVISIQENQPIALGVWKTTGLSFRVAAEGGTLYITEFSYTYVRACNKCSLKVGKMPIHSNGFRMESEAGQFFLQGIFQDAGKVELRIQSRSKSCALDQSIEAVPVQSIKSSPADPRKE